jgi:hypothetical protein
MSRIPVPSNQRHGASPTPYSSPQVSFPPVERSASPLPGLSPRRQPTTASTNNMSTLSGFSHASDPRKKQNKRDEVCTCWRFRFALIDQVFFAPISYSSSLSPELVSDVVGYQEEDRVRACPQTHHFLHTPLSPKPKSTSWKACPGQRNCRCPETQPSSDRPREHYRCRSQSALCSQANRLCPGC